MKKFLLLTLFIATSSYAKVGVGNLQERDVYDFGTGMSVSYFDDMISASVDSLHLFRSLNRPFDYMFLKVGMGANIYVGDDLNVDYTTGFSFIASLGYLYVQDQYHEKSSLKKFGAGTTVDVTYTDELGFGVGASLYIILNRFIIGAGSGVFIPSEDGVNTGIFEDDNLVPYISLSFAAAF